ncbi:glycosyltransferase family 4 protein [Haliangium sp.]|uniref:glycosyltransferase family 4 protein n=1 Tax=Haliangium sp. TaxID=2663208 RepID=UPI003D148BD7
MRVGVVTTSYPRAPGDPAGSFVAEHVDWLRRAGHRVEVVCAGAGPGGVEHVAWQPDVHVCTVPAPADLFYAGGAPEALDARGGRALAQAARFTAALWATVRRRSKRWERVFAHWLVPSAAAVLGQRRRLPVVAVAHSGDVHLLCRLGLVTPMAAALYARGAGLAFVSAELRERFLAAVTPARLAHALGRRAGVIPMGVAVDRLRGDQGSGASPSPSGSHRTVLFLGRLVPIKGVDLLLAAADRLPPACGPVRVIVAGDGPLRAALSARAAQVRRCRVELVGEVRGRARDQLLAAADVLVLPSRPMGARREGTPVAALEAMAAGTAVVATDTGGLGDLPAAVITRVRPDDPAALGEALAACLLDDLARERQRRAAARWVEQHDWSRVGARLWDLSTESSG